MTKTQTEARKTTQELLGLGSDGRRQHLARYWASPEGNRHDFDYLDRLTAWVATDCGITYDQAYEQGLADIDALRGL